MRNRRTRIASRSCDSSEPFFHRRTRRTGFTAGVVALGLGLSACDGSPFDGEEVAEAEFFFSLDATGRTEFRLDGINGNIDVVAESDTEEFIVSGFRRVRSSSLADAQSQLQRLQVEVAAIGDAIVIRTEQPSNTGGRTFEVEYDLIVPERLEADVVNVNGNILVDSMEDDAEIRTTNGNITLQDHVGNAVVALTNGNIVANATMPLGGLIDLSAVNGNIDLDIPESTSAAFSARLANGTIEVSGLDLSDQEITPTSVTGVLGGGNGDIDIETVNGNISVDGF